MKRAIAAVSIALASVATAGAQQTGSPSRTKLVMLGTGNPNADPDRFGPAVAIVVDDAAYIVDAGVGVVRRAAAAARAGAPALAVTNLRRAFITHLHSDHTLGLADLILSPWVLERPTPIDLYGPHGLKAMTDHLLAAYSDDIRIRRTGGEPKHPSDAESVGVHEIEPGVVYRDERVTVTAFAVPHGSWPQAFGYTFTTPDRTIVISGDTGPGSQIDRQCRGCDVLVHEVYSAAALARRPAAWQAYHRRYHTSAPELAAIAKRARPKLLVLYHQLFWSATEQELLEEITDRYDGTVVSARDLDVY